MQLVHSGVHVQRYVKRIARTLVNSFSWRHKQVLLCAPDSFVAYDLGDRLGRLLDDADDGRNHLPVRLLRVAPGMCI